MLMGHSKKKTDKAKFMNDIAQNVPVVEVFTEKSACIVDGMSIVHKLDGNQKTFGDIAKTVLKIVIREGDKSDRVDVVFDVYREGSIKDAERLNHYSSHVVRSVGALVRWERPLSMILSPLKKRQTHGFFCMQRCI